MRGATQATSSNSWLVDKRFADECMVPLAKLDDNGGP